MTADETIELLAKAGIPPATTASLLITEGPFCPICGAPGQATSCANCGAHLTDT